MKIYTLTWFSSNSSTILGAYSTFELAEKDMCSLLDEDETIDLENAYSWGGVSYYPILHSNSDKKYFEIRLLYLDGNEEGTDEDLDEDEDDDEDENSDAIAVLQELLKRDDVKVELEIVIEGE